MGWPSEAASKATAQAYRKKYMDSITRKIAINSHDGTLQQLIVLFADAPQAVTVAFNKENFTLTMDGNVVLGSRGIEVFLPDPDYAGYGSAELYITGACTLDNVQIKPMHPTAMDGAQKRSTEIKGAMLSNVSIDGTVEIGQGCVLDRVSIKQPRELKRGLTPVVVGAGVKATGSYIKNHVGENTQLGNNVNVSAPIGHNLIIPDNRAVYKTIDGAAAPTLVDDDMLELLDALKDMEEAL